VKAIAQVLAELDQLYAGGWREAVFIVDDNFIGNGQKNKNSRELDELAHWSTPAARLVRLIL